MFLGHINDLRPQEKKPLRQFQNRKILVERDGGYYLANNVCPHQGSLILADRGFNLTCQYHGWSWNDDGEPATAGTTRLCNNSKIVMKPAAAVNGLLFSESYDLGSLADIDLTHMQLVEERVDTVRADFKNIIDVFLDVDHIPIVHRGLYDSIGIGSTDIKWVYHDWGNLQLVEKTSDYSSEFRSTLLGDEKIAASWITIYPYTMIEWQPGAMFITVCVPDQNSTDVVVYKYRDQRYSDHNWQMNDAIWEEAWRQDRHQAESIVKNSVAPNNLEESKLHFRKWIDR